MPRKPKTLLNIEHLKQTIEAMQPDRREIAERLYGRLEFMNKTLDNLQEQVKEEGETSLFTQGSQEFVRENPALKAYNTTIQRYALVCKQLVDMLPKPEEKPQSDPLIDFIKDGKK